MTIKLQKYNLKWLFYLDFWAKIKHNNIKLSLKFLTGYDFKIIKKPDYKYFIVFLDITLITNSYWHNLQFELIQLQK